MSPLSLGFDAKRSLLCLVAAAAVVMAGCASTSSPAPQKNSGFLTETYYDKLASVQAPEDQVVYRFIAPGFDKSAYHHAIITPVTVFPKPQPTEQISMEMMLTLQGKLTRLIEDAMASAIPITNTSAPGVLRVEMAITGISISNEDLAPYEYLPFALVAAGVNSAAGGRDQEVKLFLETKLTDSVSGDVLAVGVREISGEDLENVKEKLQAQHLNQGLEDAGKDMARAIKEMFQ
ncbi:DUF3313 domain-containing protein [Echinimonas agarilytica]|uniref:DUF3313 domain-containing protein n=1 Tax=Echinimonas agarilytica TaxID=1215918 RepID=A0AA41W5T8_9GAMM|nr:DUF3313 domain-containing protein [Echinimonas agarilytica]MCM2679594.1 DUF3313 domain-containing protein [Echinimonas agarilytica]